MALHPLKLPKSAGLLFRIAALQKRLLKCLADPTLVPSTVNTKWVQRVWCNLDAEWVRKFCLDGQEARIQAIAAATPSARQALYEEFCRQNNVGKLWLSSGDFRDLETLPGVDKALASNVAGFFQRCYKSLSTDTHRQWAGYVLGTGRILSNRAYKYDFCSSYPANVVCVYCDGEIGTPELDHYLCKSGFPLLACSPWNLIPICRSCNDAVTAKGDRLALTEGLPRSSSDWLHPFFRPANESVQIRLSGPPETSIPQLHSPDPTEQTRLENHTNLIRSLSARWTKGVASYHDRLVRQVNKALKQPASSLDEVVRVQLESHLEDRAKFPSTMIHAAVCRAVLDRRPEYLEEFADSNPPTLA